jgi:ribosome biogenesis GTPase / thiamine phosphate phosphatase
LRATIYKSTGSWYTAKTAKGELVQCRIKGIFKLDTDITSTNPVAVGDEVEIEWEENEQTAVITHILSRRNYIVRTSPHKKNQKHIVAANLDQAVLVATLREPRTSQGFIDRFLVTAAAYHIPAIIVFNKSDLYRQKEIQQFSTLKLMYEQIRYSVILTSIPEEESITDLQKVLQGKVTLFSGHSGVGKSSLLNCLVPDLSLKTQSVSGWSGKGIHTTTFADTIELPFGGRVIDTPGIREFGIVDIPRAEVSHYFVEMQPYIPRCAFNNCLHTDEPDCAVKAAMEKGKINVERYISYLNILDSIEEQSY